jgi:hypothetical protein
MGALGMLCHRTLPRVEETTAPAGRETTARSRRLTARCQRNRSLPTWPRVDPPAVNHSSTAPHYVLGMDERQTLALQALRELLDNPDRDKWDKLVAASRTLIKAIETGHSARQLADVIMIDRNATAAAEIATLRQKLAATEARIREMADTDTDNAFKRFTSWTSDKVKGALTLNDMRERMVALLRDMNNPVEG